MRLRYEIVAEKNAHRHRRRQDEKRALREAGSWEIAHVIRSTAEMIYSFRLMRRWNISNAATKSRKPLTKILTSSQKGMNPFTQEVVAIVTSTKLNDGESFEWAFTNHLMR